MALSVARYHLSMAQLKSFLRFDKFVSDRRVTSQWEVWSRSGGHQEIGHVSWYAPWRRYVFYPKHDTLWDAACLLEIAQFLVRETDQQKLATARRTGKNVVSATLRALGASE